MRLVRFVEAENWIQIGDHEETNNPQNNYGQDFQLPVEQKPTLMNCTLKMRLVQYAQGDNWFQIAEREEINKKQNTESK
jgi:hypothetical protein